MADTKVNVNMIGDGQVATNTIAPDAVTTAKVIDGTLTNADFSPTANISVSKINSPGGADVFLRGDGVFATNDTTAIDEVAFNVGVLGFKMAVNEGLTIFNLVDGVVDEFNSEGGIDTAENSNASYDSTSDFYQNGTPAPAPIPQSTFFAFTSPGTYNNPSLVTSADILIVAGGGGGGGKAQAGGGGAGGVVFGESVTLTAGASYPITVGEGGAGGAENVEDSGDNGADSTFTFPTPLVVTAIGGGAGLRNNYGYPSPENSESQGGSSGGAGGGGVTSGTAGLAIPKLTQPVPSDFTAFGNDGGGHGNTGSGSGSGGGGAGTAGEQGGGNGTGDAGAGQPFTDFPGPVIAPVVPAGVVTAVGPTGVFGGGGSGGLGTNYTVAGDIPPVGGGGAGGAVPGPGADGTPGVNGTGGGGGGSAGEAPPYGAGGNGGDGIVLIRHTTTLNTASTMTLVSDTFTANSTPTKARIVVFAEIADDLNTDISASATRDNTTFNSITLTDTGYVSGSSGTKIFTGSTPLTGSASPQVQLRWKITGSSLTGANKIHGVSLQWA